MTDYLKRKTPRGLRDLVAPIYLSYLENSSNIAHKPENKTYEVRSEAPDHILIVVIDALRPEYANSLPITSSTVITPGTWTFPAVTSIHTGMYPHNHGSFAHTTPESDVYALPEQSECKRVLPTELEKAGYSTFASCAFLMPFLAIKGWYQTHKVYADAPAEKVLNSYKKWRNGKNKTYAYLHLGDLHEPLNPPKEFARRNNVDCSIKNIQTWDHEDNFNTKKDWQKYKENRRRLYQSSFDYVSEKLKEIIQGYSDDTLVVVTGDHGEAMWESPKVDNLFTDSREGTGTGHGGTPLDTVARVPIGISHPRNKNLLPSGGWGSLCDIAGTIGGEVSDKIDMSDQIWQNAIPIDRSVICEASRYGTERKAVYKDKKKIIHSNEDGITLLARISRDEPGEEFEDDYSKEEIQDIISALPKESEPNTRDNVNNVIKGQLEALGYK
ncbi:arylsulfatase A family protein [Halogeometricum pallidum JCM 14848]|uniref:Arylsulfatase A family protein n=1 Tax=Halogeometricum pallidum JCM 14848 TaxID=1227487 RepID=M0DB19_HALPD|nr:arylsulfatase A family protein [Halogeometricum pallidum JCM 14848]